MAIKVSGTTVIDDSRNLQNIGNLNTTGNVYANTFFGDAGQLTNINSGDTGIFTATTSGAVGSGAPVIVNADGTVSKIEDTSFMQEVGSPQEFYNSGSTQIMGLVYDTANEKVVVFAGDKAYVGTVSGTSITWGTGVQYSNYAEETRAQYDPVSGKIIIVYRDSGNNQYATMRIATVSGTTISFTSATVLYSNNSSEIQTVYDPDNDVYVFMFFYGYQVYIFAISMSSSGVPTVKGQHDLGSHTDYARPVYDTANNRLVVFHRNRSYNRTEVKVSTSFNTNGEYSFSSAHNLSDYSLNVTYSSYMPLYHPSSGKVLLAYKDNSAGYTKVVAMTVDSSGVDAGTPVELYNNDAQSSGWGSLYDTRANQAYFLFNTNQSNVKEFSMRKVGVSGSAVSVEDSTWNSNAGTIHIDDQLGHRPEILVDPTTDNFIVVYNRNADSNHNHSRVISPQRFSTTLTSENFIGISGGDYSNNVTANVQIKTAISDKVSGLTIGKTYYVQSDGSLQYEAFNYAGRIAGATHTGNEFATNSQTSQMYGGAFNNDGTKFYGVSSGTEFVYQYSLSTAYDLGSMSYDSVTLNAAGAGTPIDIAWNTDGTKLFTVTSQYDRVGMYTLTTGFDLSTASYSYVTASVSSQTSNPAGVKFNSDGTKMFVSESSSPYKIYEYTLTSGFDLSTANYASKSLTHTFNDHNGVSMSKHPVGFTFNSDGTVLYVTSKNNDDHNLVKYVLSTAYDITTAQQTQVTELGALVSSGNMTQDQYMVLVSPDETKFFTKDQNRMYEFSSASGTLLTTATAGTSVASNKLIVKG